MPKSLKTLNQNLARNLAFFMERAGYPSANALSKACNGRPTQTSISYYLRPGEKPTVGKKTEGYPTLDKVEKLAKALHCEVWELLHPNIEQSIRERDMYKQIEHNFKILPAVTDGEEETLC